MILKQIMNVVTNLIALVPKAVAGVTNLVAWLGEQAVSFLNSLVALIDRASDYLDDAFSEE